jgi:hypothetical protein
MVKNDIISGVEQKYRINLNRAEEEALQDLLSDQSIVIRPCDKGSGVCVINTEDYVHKIENELQFPFFNISNQFCHVDILICWNKF